MNKTEKQKTKQERDYFRIKQNKGILLYRENGSNLMTPGGETNTI